MPSCAAMTRSALSIPSRVLHRPASAVKPLRWLLPLLALILLPACGGGQSAPVVEGAGTATAAAAAPAVQEIRIDVEGLHRDASILAADSLEGRRVGTPGNAMARAWLVGRLQEIGVEPLGAGASDAPAVDGTGGFGVGFPAIIGEDNQPVEGVNLVGRIQGTRPDGPVIVLGAHYDHLGIRDGEIFNGADDNASGTSGVLAMARQLQAARPTHTVILALFDGEEGGLRGARAFVGNPPVPLDRIALMVNLDMVGRNDAGELYAVGTHHRPGLAPLVDEVAADAPVTLLKGHDSPDLPPGDDWTSASDHGPFHQQGVPFLYFGVEDHPDYHQPTDTADRLQPEFHAAAVETILRVLEAADRELAGGSSGWR